MPNLKSLLLLIVISYEWIPPSVMPPRRLGGKDSLWVGQTLTWRCKPLWHSQSGTEALAAWPHLKLLFGSQCGSHGLRKVSLRKVRPMFHMKLMSCSTLRPELTKELAIFTAVSADTDPSWTMMSITIFISLITHSKPVVSKTFVLANSLSRRREDLDAELWIHSLQKYLLSTYNGQKVMRACITIAKKTPSPTPRTQPIYSQGPREYDKALQQQPWGRVGMGVVGPSTARGKAAIKGTNTHPPAVSSVVYGSDT